MKLPKMRLPKIYILVAMLTLLLLGRLDTLRAEEIAVPFPDTLQAATISVDRLDSVLKYALILGNGDINALLYAEEGQVRLMLTKNDVWDARLDSKLDPPIPTLDLIKGRAGRPAKKVLLPKGVKWKGPDSYAAHPYPCPRACAMLSMSMKAIPAKQTKKATFSGRLDLRRAVADVFDKPGGKSIAQIRALADRNVFLIKAQCTGELVAMKSDDIPGAKSGSTLGVKWLTQQFPGDLDWPGMNYTVAMAAEGDLTAVAIVTSNETDDPKAKAIALARDTVASSYAKSVEQHESPWEQFWTRSGIKIDEPSLSNIWYRNLYFLRCVSKPGVISPGLYAGLTSDKPVWHGDYHTNYNIQQTFWSSYVTNHVELSEPYDRLILEHMPRSRWLCQKIFSIDGAYIPFVMFAFEPSDPEKCKSPHGRQYFHHVWGFTLGVPAFSAQPLWLHYKYAPDRKFLEKVAYPVVRGVAIFQANFMDLCKGEEQVVLAPTISPEHWGWTKNFSRNRNSTFDIAMFRYMFEAAIEGATTLECDAKLVTRWQRSLKRLPPYPTTKTAPPIVVDVQDAPPIEYNIAVPATPVFPGDVVTWFSPEAEKELFSRTIKGLRWNGNNATICLAVARARLSMPDALDWILKEFTARERPNGTLTLNKLGSPYNDNGHYTEMFGASMAVSELLIQSVGDILRVFPAWPKDRDATFTDLRTQGGFLVSATLKNGQVEQVKVHSTIGGRLRLLSPWDKIRVVRGDGKPTPLKPDASGIVSLETTSGEQLTFQP